MKAYRTASRALVAWCAVLAILVLAATACSDSDGIADDAQTDEESDTGTPEQSGGSVDSTAADPGRALTIVSVSHARCDWDPFWCNVEDGQNAAAEALGLTHTLLAPDSFDLDQVTELIEQAVASAPDALAVAIADADRYRPALQAAIEAGIPVVAYNSGSTPEEDGIDYLSFIGQDDYAGGSLGAERLIADGATGRGVCINQQVGSRSLDRRCQGFIDAMAEAGLEASVLEVSDDPTQSASSITQFVDDNPDTATFLTLGPNGAAAYYQFLSQAGEASETFRHGTFDLSDDIRANVLSGETLFGIDQQPFLQGFAALSTLTNYLRYGLTPASELTPTGPGFVTAEVLSNPAPDPDRPLRLISVQHGRCDWDGFWCVVEEGQRVATSVMGVDHTVLAPDGFDLERVKGLIDEAVASQPDGIALTVTNPQLFAPSIQAALDAGIPVVAYNSGAGPTADDIDYLTYFGQDDYAGGKQSAERLLAAGGGNRAVCINQQVGQRSLDRRCNGFSDAMNAAGVPVAVLEIGDDPDSAASVIGQYYAAFPDTDTILTLGPNGASGYYRFVEASGVDPDSLFHGTFDLSSEIVENISSGRTEFGVDQQPFLQGYESIRALTHLLRRDLTPVAAVSPTGPGFVTAENVALVEALAGTYR